jgi:aminoglycoside phosphotransferase
MKVILKPKFFKKSTKKRTITFKADAEMASWLSKQGINLSEVCRDALEQVFEAMKAQGRGKK